jgi:hypothetical protein
MSVGTEALYVNEPRNCWLYTLACPTHFDLAIHFPSSTRNKNDNSGFQSYLYAGPTSNTHISLQHLGHNLESADMAHFLVFALLLLHTFASPTPASDKGFGLSKREDPTFGDTGGFTDLNIQQIADGFGDACSLAKAAKAAVCAVVQWTITNTDEKFRPKLVEKSSTNTFRTKRYIACSGCSITSSAKTQAPEIRTAIRHKRTNLARLSCPLSPSGRISQMKKEYFHAQTQWSWALHAMATRKTQPWFFANLV